MKTQRIDFITQYTDWIKNNSAQRFVNGYDEITTPFLDVHNDLIQFYVRKDGDEFFFTDDGYTLADIEMNGLNLDTQKRKKMISDLATSLSVTIQDGAITAKAGNPSMVAQTEHIMLQAMLKFGDMFYLMSPHIKGIFLDDVRTFFDENDIRFTPSAMFPGKSGLPQRFDFVIPASRKQPERVITTLNQPSRQSVQSAIFSWNDVKDTRREGAEGYLILNDKKARSNVLIDAAKQYNIHAFWWNDRAAYVERLAS